MGGVGRLLVDVALPEVFVRRLYGPRLMPLLRSLRELSAQVSVRPYLMQRVQGRPVSHFLHARWQLMHAFFTWIRLDLTMLVGGWSMPEGPRG